LASTASLSERGGLLVSTIDDFWALVQRLTDRGARGGERILTEDAVAPVAADQLTAAQLDQARRFLGDGGWGFCMAVPADGTDGVAGFGRGGTGATWRSGVDGDVTGILFTQEAMTDPQPSKLFADFWRTARAWVR
jgi:hypothetical protein